MKCDVNGRVGTRRRINPDRSSNCVIKYPMSSGLIRSESERADGDYITAIRSWRLVDQHSLMTRAIAGCPYREVPRASRASARLSSHDVIDSMYGGPSEPLRASGSHFYPTSSSSIVRSSIVKLAPMPLPPLVAVSVPSCASTMLRLIDSPSPSPPKVLLVESAP
jgi:hypothetical protein